MQHETTQALCAVPSLQQVIQRLKNEKALVNAALGKAPVSEWETPAIRAMCNREQELHIALDVLEKLEPQPMQIAVPAAMIVFRARDDRGEMPVYRVMAGYRSESDALAVMSILRGGA